MALNIPLPDSFANSALKGFTTGSDFYRKLVQNATERANVQHMQKMEPYHIKRMEAEIANNNAANRRAEETLPYQLRHMTGVETRANSASGRNAEARSEAHQRYMDEQDPLHGLHKYQKLKEAIEKMRNGKGKGQIASGNIDLNNRPVVNNPEGGKSTVLTMGISEDGKHINIPRVSDDGRILNEKEAIDQFHKTGKHLGVFDSQKSADEAAQQLHQDQEKQYMPEDQGQNSYMESAPGAEHQLPSYIQAAMKNGVLPPNMGAQPQQQNAQPQSQSGSLIPGVSDEYIDQNLLANALGIKLPKAASAGKSVEDQARLHAMNREFDIAHPTKEALTKETPEEKLQNQIRLNQAKLEQESNFKASQKKKEDVEYYTKAAPDLLRSIASLHEAKDITENNPDIFGHSNEEKYLKISPNKNAGYLVRQVLPSVIDTETKLSRAGSQLALKISKGKVPGLTDSQQTALGKLDAAIKEKELDYAKALKLSGQSGTTKGYLDGVSHTIPNEELEEFLKEKGATLYGR